MNKEEILDLLNAIRVQIDEAKVSDYKLDERVSELEELIKVVEDTKTEIKYLSEKLTNDTNYLRNGQYLYDESTIFYLEDRLAAREKEEQDNLDAIKSYQALIENAHRSINYHETIIAVAERKLSDELMEKGPELRDSLNLTEEEFEKISGALRTKRETIESYKENLENIREDLVEYEAKLAELLTQTAGLTAAREEAQLQLSLYSKEARERTIVDEEAKILDRKKLASAEERLAEYDRIDTRLSYDFERQIVSMIEDYKNGSITHEQLVERLTEFKSYLDEELVYANVVETYSGDELYSNKKAVVDLEREIAELEAKLANEDNYLVSPFVIERNNRNLAKTQKNLSNIDKQISGYIEENEHLQADIVTATEMIEESERAIEECQRQIRKLGADIDPEVEKLILAKISSHKADIVYLENTKLEASRILEHNSMELELLVAKQERFRIVCDRMAASLDKKNSTDLAARRIDETELARKRSALAALKMRGLVCNASLIENIEQILSSEELVVEKEIEEEINHDVPNSGDSDFPTDEPTPEETSMDEVKEEVQEEKAVEPAEPSVDEVSEKEVSEPTFESLETKFGMDPIGLGDTRGWKFKYNEAENEELIKKSKDKKFTKKLKGFFNGMTKCVAYVMAATTSIVLAGLHPIKTAKAVKSYLKRAQEDPERIEEMTQEDVERELVEEIEADNTLEPVQTTNEDEIVINTNDGETITVDVSGSEETLVESELDEISLEEIDDEDLVDVQTLLSGSPTIDEETIEMDFPVEEIEETIEEPVVEQETEEAALEETTSEVPADEVAEEEPTLEEQVEPATVEETTIDEDQAAREEAEEFLATLEDEELDIPAEAVETEAEEVTAEESALTSRLSKLSEEEINDIIAQISKEMAYEVSTNEVEEEARKLR